MNATLNLIASRRSHRAYRPDQLTQDQLQAILNAALQSPSAVNRQPWHFTVVQNQELLDEINLAVRENVMQKDASLRSPRFADEQFHVFYHAPTVIFIAGDTENKWAQIDCGIAVQNIALAAESLGLGSVILGMPREAFQGDKAPAIRKALSFPQNYDFVIGIAIGTATDDKDAHPIQEGKIAIVK